METFRYLPNVTTLRLNEKAKTPPHAVVWSAADKKMNIQYLIS